MMKRWIAVKISEVNSKVERLFNYGISNVYIYIMLMRLAGHV